MNPIILPLAAIVLLGAEDNVAPPRFSEPQAVIREIRPYSQPGKQCRDSALPTDSNPSQQPRLEREPATPGDGSIIYAVDRRVDGCSVVLVKNNFRLQLIKRPFGKLSPEEIEEIKRRR